MNYRIVLSPDAKADISSAVWWYQRRDPNLAFRFTLEAFETLRRIARYPYSYRLIKGVVGEQILRETRFLSANVTYPRAIVRFLVVATRD